MRKERYSEDEIGAIVTLAILKRTKLDSLTLSALDEHKTKYLEAIRKNITRRILQITNEKITPEATTSPANNIILGNQQSPAGESSSSSSVDGYIPPDIPPVPSLHGFIRICSRPFQKQLTETDVKDSQNRLSMKKMHVEELLKPLLGPEEDLVKGIPVTTFDYRGTAYPMVFKIWVSKIYVLINGWKRFQNDHGLRKNEDFVTIWMFRHYVTGNLCFVIIARRLPGAQPLKIKRIKHNHLSNSNNEVA